MNLDEGLTPQSSAKPDSTSEKSSGKTEAPNWYFENIAALSDSARTIHVIYVGFLIFCALTIISTSDPQIILNEGAKLPLLNVDVKFSVFLITAPLVAVFMFVYFQMHVHVLKRAVLELHGAYEIPPKGRLYPWMINLAEEPEIGAMGLLQRFIVQISLWWLLPIVLLLFAWLTLRMGNRFLSFLELLIFGVGILLVFWLYGRYQDVPTKGNNSNPRSSRYDTWLDRYYMQLVLAIIILRVLLQLLANIPSPDSQTAQASIDLSGRMLKGAHLRNTRLQSAKLEFANLEDANLSRASLERANFAGAILKQADIRDSKLVNANLNCANLSGSRLEGADLTGAFLIGTNLLGAFVTPEQLKKANSLYLAKLDPDLENKLGNNRVTSLPIENVLIESYKSKPDPQPINQWKITRLRPPGYESDNRTFLINEKYAEQLEDNSELATRLPSSEWRIQIDDRTLLVSRPEEGGAVAEVRFFQTMTLERKLLLSRERTPNVIVPCLVPEQVMTSELSHAYDSYAGQYELAPNLNLNVIRDGEDLMAGMPGKSNQKLFPVSATTFFSVELESQLTFMKSDQGTIDSIILTKNGFTYTARKVK